ncbi:MAG: hypothetical protein CMO34_03615 [Verrucomicrobia bacterium]|nr:hypothetical protein [Verrucomicrobiota bacterium]|tara:strand:+ start:575 stop:1360 length:786 start_codon:yes stop_codon:yes gene_type:complete
MPVITLTTDLGLNDHYVGAVKGGLIKGCPEATIVDISHLIPPYNILQAAFTLKNAFTAFPEGSIHIVGVTPTVELDTQHLLIKEDGHYFIGADNGLFSLLFPQKPKKVYRLNIVAQPEFMSFPTRDIYTKAACHIAQGGTPEMIAVASDEILERSMFQATTVGNLIKGMVIHVDHYGNIITNIDEQLFNSFGRNRNFKIEFRHGNYDITEVNKSYSDVPQGEKLALFSSNKMLEIAMNQGNASQLLGISESDTIRIEFYDR